MALGRLGHFLFIFSMKHKQTDAEFVLCCGSSTFSTELNVLHRRMTRCQLGLVVVGLVKKILSFLPSKKEMKANGMFCSTFGFIFMNIED